MVLPHEPGEGQGQGVGGVGQSLSVQHHMSRGGVIPAPDGPLLLLPGLLPAEQLIELVRHKQGAHGGAVFCLLLDHCGAIGSAGLLDMDDAALEVHALPFQAADLLPPQTQPSGDLDPVSYTHLDVYKRQVVRAETGFVKEQYKLILRWERRYTAGHDPETSKTIYKNVLGRTQEEAKEKLNAAIKETQSLDLQKLYKKLLTKDWVDRLKAKGQPKGLSAKTVRNIHQILSSALKLAQKQRIILTNPAEGRALPKVEHREMKTLPVEQLASFLREAKESGVFELYYVELATGLRRGELLGGRTLIWTEVTSGYGGRSPA